MGSMCWVQCYWCDYWVWDPYIIDYIGRPLCNLCFDWHLGIDGFEAERLAVEARGEIEWFGGPYEPTEITRTTRRLQHFFVLDTATSRLVAEFLRPWHAP